MNKWLFAVPIFIFVVVIALFATYMQMKKMPTSTMKVIRNTIRERNSEEFYKLVDVDKILEQAAEEIIVAKLNQDTTAYSTQQVAEVYNNQLKPEFMNVTKQAVAEYIQTGKVTLPQPVQSETQRWLKHSEINSCEITSMSKPIYTGDTAKAIVNFRNTKLNFTFEIEVDLERVEGNTWKIVGAKGFEDYNRMLKHALVKKLDQINAPIRDQMDDIIQIKELKAKIGEGDEYGFSQTLRIAIKAEVKSKKPLSKILGKIIVDDGQERENSTAFTIDMAYHPQGLQTFNVDKVLNPFVRGDVNIMKHGMRKSQLSAEIEEIIFLDGTNLKTLDKLPD